MTITKEYCDFCMKEITNKSDKFGFCTEIGYSENGWGDRQNFDKRSVEICGECFKKVKEKTIEYKKFINSLYA